MSTPHLYILIGSHQPCCVTPDCSEPARGARLQRVISFNWPSIPSKIEEERNNKASSSPKSHSNRCIFSGCFPFAGWRAVEVPPVAPVPVCPHCARSPTRVTLACAPSPARSSKPLRLKFQLRKRNNYPPLHISSKMVANASQPSHRLPLRLGARRRAAVPVTFSG